MDDAEHQLVNAWFRNFQNEPVTAREVITKALDEDEVLFAVLVKICPTYVEQAKPKHFSKWLFAQENKPILLGQSHVRFAASRDPGCEVRWRLAPVLRIVTPANNTQEGVQLW